MLFRFPARQHIVLTLLMLSPALAAAQAPAPAVTTQPAPERDTGIHGVTTTQEGSVFLPGVVVTVLDRAGRIVAEMISGGDGTFGFPTLNPGTYTVRAFLDGFAQAVKQSIIVAGGQWIDVKIDLPIAKINERVDVQAARGAPLEASAPLVAAGGRTLEVGPLKGDNFDSLLPVLPGILRSQDGHISIKGATATQSSVQINSANVTDPSTGNMGFDLPNDAVDSVEVQTNPYAPEFGRFSSGVTMLNTTRGGPRWSFVPNGFIPRFYRSKDNWWDILGIRSFRPRFSLGGPLVKDKVFLFNSVLYRYIKTPFPDLPGEQNTKVTELKTFTRVDANASPRQSLNFTVATFPQQMDRANLGQFNQSGVASNFHQGGFNATGSQDIAVSDTTLVQSTAAVKRYDVRVAGGGVTDMNITPEGNTGNYFNRQERDSTTYQFVTSLTTTKKSKTAGEHLLKFGADLLRVDYTGTSDSSPVNVLRADGTRAARLVFGGPTVQTQGSTEMALVAQDHWRLSDRATLEFGGRIDHDGVLERFNFTPRVGGAVSLRGDGSMMLRGGTGLFYERTPLNVGAFPSFEARTVTNYALDGTTIAGSQITYVNRLAPDMRTPYSRIWNIEFDERVNDRLSFKVNHLERAGHREFIVDPTLGPTPAIVLSSTGETRYQETEVSARWMLTGRADTTVSYVYSRDRSDLNTYDLYFGNNRDPLIRPNEYGRAPVDAPHRVLIRGGYDLPGRIRFDPLIDVRSGFPLSTMAEDQSYIGGRNQTGRYPTFFSFDFSASRPVKIWKYTATIGVRMFDTLGTFNPRDAWRTVGSPNFGRFANGVPRDFQTFIELGRR
jgi:hypothetical protein